MTLRRSEAGMLRARRTATPPPALRAMIRLSIGGD
jgi:hypothetical protein